MSVATGTGLFEKIKQGGLAGLSGVMAIACAAMAILLAIFLVGLIAASLDALAGSPSNSPFAPFRGFATSPPSPTTVIRYDCQPSARGLACRPTKTVYPPGKYPPGPSGQDMRRQAYLTEIAALAAMSPALGLLYGLFQASACFVGIAKGRYFDRSTMNRLRNFALGGLIFALGYLLSGHIGSVVFDFESYLSRHVFPIKGIIEPLSYTYHGDISFRFSERAISFFMVIYAVTVTILAAVLAKASSIAKDYAQIV